MKLWLTLLLPIFIFTAVTIGCKEKEPVKIPDSNIFDAIASSDVTAVEQHLNSGTDPNKSFIPEGYPLAGASALHLAVVKGNQDVVELLLKKGANIEITAKDQPQGTPLQWTAYFAVLDMTKFLVDFGANINAKDKNGCTALCATTIPNPFIEEKDTEEFLKNRIEIQKFLKANGAKMK